jgi:predicted nucleic acid-binding protein
MDAIFDRCIWGDLAGNQVDRQDVIEAAGDAPIFTSAISLGELSYGLQSCMDPIERTVRASYLRQVDSRPTLDINKHTAAAFGVLAAAVKVAGRSSPHVQRLVDSRTDHRKRLHASHTKWQRLFGLAGVAACNPVKESALGNCPARLPRCLAVVG